MDMERFMMIALLLFCCGCDKSGELDRASISGMVTLDGVAVAEGSIVFRPIDGTKGPIAGAVIQNGRYAIGRAKGPVAGNNRVEISAFKKTGRKVSSRFGGTVDEAVESVPDRYNSSSTLAATIKSGKNTLDYELTSK